jgi:predicted dehydrogenase
MYRYNPTIREVIDNAKNGVYGDIISVEAQMCGYSEKTMRQWLEVFPGGMMFYLGCHLVDLILTIKGLPEKVYPFNRATGIDGVTGCDYGLALFEYPEGMSIAKTCNIEHGGFERRRLVVCGTKGAVELCPLEWLTKHKANQFTEKIDYNKGTDWHARGEKTVGEVHDRYDTMMQGFAEICRGERVNEYTPDYELTLFKYILMACGKELN